MKRFSPETQPAAWGFLAARVLAVLALVSLAISARADALDNWTPSQVVTNRLGYMGLLFSGVTYGNGRYVAVGEYASDDSGVVQISGDGLHWTNETPQDYSILDLYDVAFGNGTFVAVGWDWFGGKNIYHSTNGINWTPHYTAIANINRVAYGAGLFVAVGDGQLLQGVGTTNRNIYTSADGITWMARNSTASASSVQSLNDVAYGAGRFVAVAGANAVYTSTTGYTWTPAGLASAGNRVSFGNSLFFIPAGAGTNLVSNDGLNWSVLTNNMAVAFGRVLFADGCYLAASGSSVFSSRDGTNWVMRAAGLPPNVSLRAIAYSNRRFLTVGYAYPPTPLLPAAYISDPIIGLSVNRGLPPTLRVTGVVGRSYRIEQLDDLRSNNWLPAATFALSNSPYAWTDTHATNVCRHYRAVLLP